MGSHVSKLFSEPALRRFVQGMFHRHATKQAKTPKHHERSIIHVFDPTPSQRPSSSTILLQLFFRLIADKATCKVWLSSLFVLDNADLGGTQHTAVQLEALLLNMEDTAILLVGLRRHEGGLVLVGVELVAIGVHALEAVLLEGGHEDGLGHLDALVQRVEVLVVAAQLLGGDGRQRAVEVVDALDQVLGELLDGEVARRLDLARRAVLKVAEVGDSAQALVL